MDIQDRTPRHSAAGITALILLLLVCGGCDLTDDNGGDPVPGLVFVANQGNFTEGNGSVTSFDPATEQVEPAAISRLGSIVQSLAIVDGRLYVMANSANRIDVFGAESLEPVAQIEEVVSPRYLLASGNTAYVTGLFGSIGQFDGGLVTVLDLESNTKLDEIAVGDNPEGLALVGSRLYVANHGFGSGSTLNVIDTATHQVVDTIDVDCDGPRFLIADEQEEVYVFCTGETVWGDEGIVSRTDGAVRILDGETGEIIERFEVDGQIGSEGAGQDAYYAPEEEVAFVVLDGTTLLQFRTDTNAQLASFGPFDGPPISAVARDPQDGRLYLGRSNGFTAAGEVSIHLPDGSEVARFDAGIVPTYVAFAR